MTDNEFLTFRVLWLEECIVLFEASNQPTSWKRDSIKRTHQQIADIQWRLECDPPRPAPSCGWKKPFADHGDRGCPKNDTRCALQYGVKLEKPKRTRPLFVALDSKTGTRVAGSPK